MSGFVAAGTILVSNVAHAFIKTYRPDGEKELCDNAKRNYINKAAGACHHFSIQPILTGIGT